MLVLVRASVATIVSNSVGCDVFLTRIVALSSYLWKGYTLSSLGRLRLRAWYYERSFLDSNGFAAMKLPVARDQENNIRSFIATANPSSLTMDKYLSYVSIPRRGYEFLWRDGTTFKQLMSLMKVILWYSSFQSIDLKCLPRRHWSVALKELICSMFWSSI